MANDLTKFFYWYRRYKVRAQDMTEFQTAMVETSRAIGEGVVGSSVLKGFSVTPVGGLVISVDPGIAIAASGYTQVLGTTIQLDVSSAATGSSPCRSLVVARPVLVNSDYINSPTAPFNSIPLRQVQSTEVSLITGIPNDNPEYPSKESNDVILCGLIIPPGTANLDTSMLDFEVRDSIGVNSLIAQNQVRFDDRLRPYRLSNSTVGIKPSQNIGSAPLGFAYPGRLSPSRYPLSGGIFIGSDSFIDFSAGIISGADTTTPSFTPTIPTGNNSIVCSVTLTLTDTLNFTYGTEGGFAQCLMSIRNQVYNGAGSLPVQDGNFPVAYVIITSRGGIFSDVHVVDTRAFLGSGAAAAKYKREIPSGTVDGLNNSFMISTLPSDPDSLLFFVDSNILRDDQYNLNGQVITITDSAVVPAPGQGVYAIYLIYGAVTNSGVGSQTGAQFFNEIPVGTVDGVNGTFNLSNVPVDPKSLFFFVDNDVLEDTDFTLLGTTVTITNPAFIPQLGQGVYVKYLYLGILPGGGGGGTSGYTAYGNRTSPIVIDETMGVSPTTDPLQQWFIKSLGGGQVVTASPQVVAGSRVGDKLILKAVDSLNYVYFNDGNGLDMNGNWPATGSDVAGQTIQFSWDGVYWSEDCRR